MHELSIARSIVDIVERHAAGRRVAKVEIKVGHLRQMVPEALAFAWELVVFDNELKGAQLVVEQVPARGVCRRCGAETEFADFPFVCAACGTLDVELIAGDELQVESLELEAPSMSGGTR